MTQPVLRGRTHVGVAIVHDIMGLDKTNLWYAERLHAEGFWVKSVDLYDRKVAKDVDEGIALRGELVDPASIRKHLTAAHAELKAAMGAGVIGSLGFCMGGGAALEGACHAPYDFCVDYYGSIAEADDVKGLRGPLLMILASEDERVNTWTSSKLLPALAKHKKRAEIQLYPAVVHPFHRPDWITSPWGGAKAYDEAAANDAWARAVAFIRAQAK